MTRGDHGFTLLELLVGLVVLGFIMAGLSQGTRFGIRAADTQARLSAGRSELDAVDRTLRHLIEGADPGTERRPASLSGTAGTVTLTARLPQGAGTVGDAEVALGVDGARRLLLRWTPRRHVVPLGPPPPGGEAELLRGVARLEIAYWQDGWRAAWDAAKLPALVRVRIVFPPGDARRWPDIVVAPKRGPDRG